MGQRKKGASKMEMGFPRPFAREIANRLGLASRDIQFLTVEFSVVNNQSVVTFENHKNKSPSFRAYWLQDKCKGQQTDTQLMWAQVDYDMACRVGIEQLGRPNKKDYQQCKVYPLTIHETSKNTISYLIGEAEDYKSGYAVMCPSCKSVILDMITSTVVHRENLLKRKKPQVQQPEQQEIVELVEPDPIVPGYVVALKIAKTIPLKYRDAAMQAIVDQVNKDQELRESVKRLLAGN